MLSVPHLLIIFLVALIVLGPEKLPQVARTVRKFMTDWESATGGLRDTFEEEMRNLERDIRDPRPSGHRSSSPDLLPALNPASTDTSEEAMEMEQETPDEFVSDPGNGEELASVDRDPFSSPDDEGEMRETPEEVPEQVEKLPEEDSGEIHDKLTAEGQSASESATPAGKPADDHTSAA